MEYITWIIVIKPILWDKKTDKELQNDLKKQRSSSTNYTPKP